MLYLPSHVGILNNTYWLTVITPAVKLTEELTIVCLVTTGIQSNLWARFVTLPNQERIWTLTVTDKSVPKPEEQGTITA